VGPTRHPCRMLARREAHCVGRRGLTDRNKAQPPSAVSGKTRQQVQGLPGPARHNTISRRVFRSPCSSELDIGRSGPSKLVLDIRVDQRQAGGGVPACWVFEFFSGAPLERGSTMHRRAFRRSRASSADTRVAELLFVNRLRKIISFAIFSRRAAGEPSSQPRPDASP